MTEVHIGLVGLVGQKVKGACLGHNGKGVNHNAKTCAFHCRGCAMVVKDFMKDTQRQVFLRAGGWQHQLNSWALLWEGSKSVGRHTIGGKKQL